MGEGMASAGTGQEQVRNEVDLVGLKPILRTTTSFRAVTLLVGSFDS